MAQLRTNLKVPVAPVPAVPPVVTPPVVPPVEPEIAKEPKPAEEKKEVSKEPEIVLVAQQELSAMIEKLDGAINSLKGQKDVTPDSLELLKLSCAKLLREATVKLEDNQKTIEKMSTVARGMETQQKGLDDAVERVNTKSETYRNERDAFVKLRSLSEREFYDLITHIAEKTKVEKAEAKAKESK